MADFGGNLVRWEGCVCGVQGKCDYCKGKLRGDLKQSGMCTRRWTPAAGGGETGCVPRGDVDMGKRGGCFFMASRAYFHIFSMKLRGVTYSSAEQFMMKCKADIGGGFPHRITHHEDGPPGGAETVGEGG